MNKENIIKYPVSYKEVNKAISFVYRDNPTPSLDKIFDAFYKCPYDKLKVIWIGQDPYPQKGVATGIAFGNEKGTTNLSKSLEILVKYASEYLEKPGKQIIFDPTLEEWEKQGVLMLNSSLTTRVNEIGRHTMIWRPVISSFLAKISWIKPDLVYVLSGSTANSFKPYIGGNKGIVSTVHPSFCARTNTPFPDVFNEVNDFLEKAGKEKIEWLHYE